MINKYAIIARGASDWYILMFLNQKCNGKVGPNKIVRWIQVKLVIAI